MTINSRLTILERLKGKEPEGIPIAPQGWTDGENKAVVKGLGLMGKPLMTLCNEAFLDKYKTYIDKIRSDYNGKGVMPDKPLIIAQPISFLEHAQYQTKKYVL